MKWLDNIVDKILKANPKEEYTCACGISTTGIAHIGNYRELIITYLVAEELKRRGKKVRLILSFDDFDRLKKVPYGIDKSYEQYIGMPNYSIPSPFNKKQGYAEYYESIVTEGLSKLGINMEYIRQSDNYLNGAYNDKIRLALDSKDMIFNIISKHKTQELTNEDMKKYYPVKIYCSNCNKDSTTINNYSNGKISYVCTCGYKENNLIDNLHIKLNFNVDWPMRWNHEKVDFEPCGKGHADINGPLAIATEINDKIFKGETPVIIKYDFVNLKNNGGRMNKNTKEIITIDDVLEIMPKEMIIWMFLTKNPNKEMSFSLDDNIIKLYNEYEKMLDSNTEESQRIKKIINANNSNIKFNDLIKFLPIVNFNIEKLKQYIEYDERNIADLNKIKYAANWLKKHSSNKYWQPLTEANTTYWEKMPITERQIIENFKSIIVKEKYENDFNEFIEKLKLNNEFKTFCKNFYNLVFGNNTGIPIKKVIENFDISIIKKLLSFKNDIIYNNKQSIIHLSDLHFDINDPNDNLMIKWEKMVNILKKNISNINYLVLSGDIICFYNMQDNYRLAYNYLSYLMDELHIDKEKVLMCMGNHEMFAMQNIETKQKLFSNFETNILPIISNYSEFQEKLIGRSIKCLDDMYYIKKFDICDFLVINSLFAFEKDNSDKFYQDESAIKKLLLNYKENNKFKFLITHAPRSDNPQLFEIDNLLEKFNITLCGHKYIECFPQKIAIGKYAELVSGNTDGFVEDKNNYNIYDINNDEIIVKKLIYNKEWKINEFDN